MLHGIIPCVIIIFKGSDKMNESRKQRMNKTSIFGKKLEELRKKKDYSIKDMAQMCNITYSHLNNLLNGLRAPSLDSLCKIAKGLNVPFEDIAYFLVLDQLLKIDEKGNKVVPVWVMTSGRGPTAGSIKFLDEQELLEFYGDDYNKNEFFSFVKRYLVDRLYKDRYEELFFDIKSPKDIYKPSLIDRPSDTSTLLYEVLESIHTLDNEGLDFIKHQINLYKKHLKR